MTLDRQLRWLDGQISLERAGLPTAGRTDGLSVDPMRELLRLLGDPHRDAPAIHLTGTNGKGSTAHLTTLILREHGLRVGTYGSPHVSRINERVQLDAEPIGDDDLAAAIEVVRLASEQLERSPSWFELLTATGFRAFSDAAVDAQVIEVGMLGRFDATNVVEAPVSVVTNIARDHTDGAPGWRDAIAREKAGIITPGATVVLGAIDDELQHWFLDEGPGSVLRWGDQIVLHANEIGVGGRVVDVETPRDRYQSVLVSLHGRHQGTNAALAIAAAEAFLETALDHDHLASALGQASIPARMEVVGREPLIVIDGAHNPHGAKAAAAAFSASFHAFGRRVLVVGTMQEKDPVEMLTALDAPTADLVVCCQPDWPRAMPSAELAAAARTLGIEPEVVESPVDAIDTALALSTDADAIFVAGSLYVAGAVRDRLLDD